MAGTRKGGQAAAARNLEKYGADFYARIGAMGGVKGRNGGFASKLVDKNGMTGHERAVEWGRKGGQISRRTKAVKPVVVNEKQDDAKLAA